MFTDEHSYYHQPPLEGANNLQGMTCPSRGEADVTVLTLRAEEKSRHSVFYTSFFLALSVAGKRADVIYFINNYTVQHQ